MPDASAGPLAGAFAPPHEETLSDGTVLTFPLMDMDDWAQCCATLAANRRKTSEARLNADQRLSMQDRAWLLMKLDDTPVLFSEAFTYRTQTPVGIKSTLVKQLVKGGISDADARAAVAKIAPVRQRQLASIIADPPWKLPDPKGTDPKNEGEASTNETGPSMPGSSEDTSESTQEA